MPYVIGRPSKFLALASSIAAMMVAAPSAIADGFNSSNPPQPTASCSSVSSNQLLSSLGDSNLYAPLPGGTFEDGGQGWSYNNASVVSGNEPWNVVNANDSQSLNISAGGSATSPVLCVDSTFPSFRFFANNNGNSGKLTVQARYTTSTGYSGTQWVTGLSAGQYSEWAPTPSVALGSQVPAGMTVNVQFVFIASNPSSWNIDDVLVDPYAK
jgi:hypothetical protein